MNDKKLTPKQELFCLEYIKDLNATQAAVRAGLSKKPRSAEVLGSRLLSKVEVKQRINELKKERKDKIMVEATDVLRELLYIAKTDLSEAYDERGYLKPIHEIPKHLRRAIAGIKVFEEFEGFGKDRTKVGEVREVKLWSKVDALNLIGKHLKMFTDVHEHTGKVTLEQLVTEAIEESES